MLQFECGTGMPTENPSFESNIIRLQMEEVWQVLITSVTVHANLRQGTLS